MKIRETMQYTILELERIERILTAKLEEAQDAYEKRLDTIKVNFKAKLVEQNRAQGDIKIHGSAVGYAEHGVSAVFSDEWDIFKREDMQLMFLWGEVDLFQRGINSLYSYWNSAVEIFIDKMRTRTDHEYPEAKRADGGNKYNDPHHV